LGELAFEGMQQGFNQYAPMAGLPLLREAIAADFAQRYQVTVDAETEITITPGATYAIYTAFTSILQPGDEVIVLEPAYDSYIPNIEMNGAKAVAVPLLAPTFEVDWDRLKEAITPATKAIIVNTPHNPTGAIWQKEDWDQLAALVAGTGIYILSDEVYEQLIYDGKKHYSVLEHPELRTRSFALYSFGKVFHNTGWKIGYCIAPPELTTAFRRIHQYLCFSVNTPAQYAIARYLALGGHYELATLLQQKRDYFLELMKSTPFHIHQPAGGSYFQVAGYKALSNLADRQCAEWLTMEHGVAAIPVSAFYRNGQDDQLLRFCFAKREATLDTAVERLKQLTVLK
jgi:methionine aminotransferase